MISNIIEFIKNLNLGTVIYGSTNDANVRLDRQAGPFIILYIVQDAQIDISGDRMIPQWHFNVLVCDRCPLDAKGEVIQEVIDRMYAITINLLRSLRGMYRMGSKFDVKQSWAKYDACVAGVSVEFTITGSPVCLSNFDPEPQPTPEPEHENS